VSATRLGLVVFAVVGLGIADPVAATDATVPEGAPAGGWEGAAAIPAPPAVADPIERAWRSPALSLDERVSRTRRASLEAGIWSLDTAARAVQNGSFPGPPLERAEAAVALAPDLPAAHMARARALWLHGDSPIAAARAAVAALGAVPRHPEASLWFGGSALLVLAIALMAGGLLCLADGAALVVPHAVHDLGDAVSVRMPGFARGALLAALLLLPLALGEGLLGLGAALLAVGATYGSARGRVVLGLAAAALLAGAYPVARLAGATLEAFAGDPVAEAAVAVAGGVPLAQDLARLEAAAEDDLVAEWSLAIQARRGGHLGTADARYQALLEALPDDAIVLNNAAAVRLALGHMESAIELYGRAAELSGWPVVLFNLSQAYGRAFQMDELARTLGRAQELDAALVAHLTALQGADTQAFVVDLPLPVSLFWRRVLESPGGAGIAAELRAPAAPGLLGRDGRLALLVFAAALIGGSLLGMRVRASRWCTRCGRRVCPRCQPESAGRATCPPCVRLFHESAGADRALRQARIDALRKRELRWERLAWFASFAVPGLAGFLSRRPLRSLLGAFFFALAATCVVFRSGAVPDPLVAGAAAPFAFVGTAIVAGAAYAASVASCLAARRRA
jgi:tetratricopeptide (TPR) repeat protein